jgi:hypothetical protein
MTFKPTNTIALIKTQVKYKPLLKQGKYLPNLMLQSPEATIRHESMIFIAPTPINPNKRYKK